MAEPPPGKHAPPSTPSTTRKAIKGPLHTSSPPTRSVPAAGPPDRKTGDNPGTIARGGAKATARFKAKKPSEELHGEVEIVVAGDELEATRVRTSVRRENQLKGLGLKQKIMIAMAGVTIGTAVLIFGAVYARSVNLLSAEIDAKGIAQARLMASIDPEVWLAALYQSAGEREERIQDLMEAFDLGWSSAAPGFYGENPELRKTYDFLKNSSIGASRADAARRFFEAVIEKRKAKLGPEKQEDLARKYEERSKRDPEWQAKFNMVFDPLGELKPLKSGGVDLFATGEIVELSVSDITGRAPVSIAAKGDPLEMSRGDKRLVGGVSIFDGYVKATSKPVRAFELDSAPLETRVGQRRLRYYVLLNLEKIEDAKSGLRLIIFLPIVLAVVVGLGIAWWLAELISEPVRLLMTDINTVSSGDLTHETAAHSSDEIGQLAVTFNRMTQALNVAHGEELKAREREHELNIASEIQANLVPKKMLKVPGYDISAYYRPSKEVGGDYYDFIEIDEDHCGIIVADVSGKGVPGSLVMAMARAFIRMEAERSRNVSPSDTLKRANRMLAADIKKGMFVTAMYCILDKTSNELAITSAGHNPMVLWRAATNEIQLVNPKGIALGFDKGPVFDRTVSEERVQLQAGDRIVLYTDGTVEAMNENSEEYGDKKFQDLARQLATRDSNQFLNLMVKSLDEHKGSAPQHDDMTIVTLRYTGGG